MAKIHFFWAGRQKTTDPYSPEMDLSGIFQMASWNLQTGNKHSIQFWCPRSLYHTYHQLIPAELQIEIKICESLFIPSKSDSQKDKWAKNRLEFLFSGLIKTENTRAWVCAKNLFSIALLYFEGGYFADSTVFPTKETRLPEYNNLKVIFLKESRNYSFEEPKGVSFCSEPAIEMLLARPKTINPVILYPDIFFMYSPQQHDIVWRALEYTIVIYPRYAKALLKLPIDDAYRQSSSIVLMGLMDAIHHADGKLFDPGLERKYEAYFFHISPVGGGNDRLIYDPYELNNIKLIKKFNRTHFAIHASTEEKSAFSAYLIEINSVFQENHLMWGHHNYFLPLKNGFGI